MPAQNGALNVGQYTVVKADNAGEDLLFGAQFFDQVFAEFLLYGSGGVAGSAEFAKGFRVGHLLRFLESVR